MSNSTGSEKRAYEAPAFEVLGSFETLTKAGTIGTTFDSNFQSGQPVPLNPNNQPIIFS